jgi:DNA polymerase III subunit gamma/tau
VEANSKFNWILVMVLYQKYRPQTFKGVVNQKPVKKSLVSAINNDQVAHAYIFSGPRGTGKTTIARILARAMNCTDRDEGQPCLECSNCKDSGSVDVIEIDAASNRKIDDIRNLREKIKFSPIAAKYKIYIVDEVHMLTKEAFNALLKILEEPPKHAIFILATTEPEKVPDTVLSRCQRFDFKPISINEMASYLGKIAKKEKVKIDKESLLMISASANGSLRDGLGVLEQVAIGSDNKVKPDDVRNILGLVEHRAIVKLLDYILDRDVNQAIELSDRLISQGIQYQRIIDSILAYLRNLLVIKLGSQLSTNLSDSQLKKAKAQSEKVEENQLSAWMEKLIDYRNNSFEGLPQLPLELLIVELVESLAENKNEKKTENDPVAKEADSKSKPRQIEKRKETDKKPVQASSSSAQDDNDDKGQDRVSSNYDIEKDWPKIVDELKNFNHSLSGIISQCQITQIKDGKVVLTVDRRFYQKRILDVKNRKTIQKAVKKVTKKTCLIDCRLDKDQKSSDKDESKTNTFSHLSQKAKEIF